MRSVAALLYFAFLINPALSQEVTQTNSGVISQEGTQSETLVYSPAKAQTQPPLKPGEACTLEGTVVKSTTGEAAKKIEVSINPVNSRFEQAQHSAMTDASGHFVFRDVAPGKYVMSAGGNGYPYQVYEQRTPGGRGKILTLEPGSHQKDIVFRLAPGGVITGAVYDADGDPVIGAEVQAFRTQGATRQVASSNGAQTNDLGNYRIYGLEPGQYYVVANRRAPNNQSEEVDLPTYYPGTADPGQASTLAVRPGDELNAIDLTMSHTHGFHVRGRVVIEGPGAAQGGYVQLIARRDNFGGMRLGNFGAPIQDSKGDFDIRAVPAGSFIAFANWNDGKSNYAGRAPVEIQNTDVDGVVLSLGPSFELHGFIRTEPGAQLDVAKLFIALQPTDNAMLGAGGAEIKPDATFIIRNVFDGNYAVRVGGFPEQFYLKSARLGGSEALTSGFNISHNQSSGTLDLELSLKGGTISGTVLHDSKPVPGAFVALVPDPPNRNREEMYSSKVADQLGRYTLLGIPPGDYHLYAWESAEGVDLRDTDFLKLHDGHGKSVHVEEKQQQAVQLDVIPAEEASQ